MATVQPYWILGQPLYKDYYVTHDYSNRLITMSPLRTYAKKPLFKSYDPYSIILPLVAPEPNIVEGRKRLLAWPITLGVVSAAMFTIVGAIALLVINCNKVPDNIEK
jgi:hypothetical protein